MLAATHDGCRVLNYNSANHQLGRWGVTCRSTTPIFLSAWSLTRMTHRSRGSRRRRGASLSLPARIPQRERRDPRVITSGFLPFNVEPTVPPVITKFQHQFDEPGWVDGNDPLIHKRQNAGAVKVTLEKRPYDQRVNIDGSPLAWSRRCG